MNRAIGPSLGLIAANVVLVSASFATDVVDRPPGPLEYGYRPAEGEVCHVTPPSFVWVIQNTAKSYELQVGAGEPFPKSDTRTFRDIIYNVYTPDTPLEPGPYWWRYRFIAADGTVSAWSRSRAFTIAPQAKPFPFITPEECRRRIPKTHPRLMLRPEDVEPLRRRIDSGPTLRDLFTELRSQADAYLKADLIPEPNVMARNHDPATMKYWWPNRVTSVKALDVANTLAFVYRMTGHGKYGQAARRWILHLAGWNPNGPTNLVLNDEAAMPFLYMLPRAYDWAFDALSEEDRSKVRSVMRTRTHAAYSLLIGRRHLDMPFESHANRMWHKMAESAICFYDELEAAPEWLNFALNCYFAVYPAWGDSDGGWHEGANYWNSYVYRSLYWMDAARAALQFEPLTKPFYQRVGDFALYVVPPHTPVGGFGDLSYHPPGSDWRHTIEYFARRLRNPYWQWWAEQWGGKPERGIFGLLREASSKPIKAKAPADLPSSRVFRGPGVAALHDTILDARQDVMFLFKSSPFGGQSHGHNPQNSFILCAYGDELLSTFVYRGEHGGRFHREYAWTTRAHNALLVDNQGQQKHSAAATGRIVAFKTTPAADYVAGDATQAYGNVKRFIRHVVFVKPDTIVLLDDVVADKPATYQWMVHGLTEMQVDRKTGTVELKRTRAGVQVAYLSPSALTFRQWSGYEPPPDIQCPTQWHVEASTTERSSDMLMLTVLCPYRLEARPTVKLERIESETAIGCRVDRRPGRSRWVAFRKPGKTGQAMLGPLVFDGAAAATTDEGTIVFPPHVVQ